jgi:hypothetical protein
MVWNSGDCYHLCNSLLQLVVVQMLLWYCICYFECLMIRRTVDFLVLSGAAITLQTAVLLLKCLHRAAANKVARPGAETTSEVVFPA